MEFRGAARLSWCLALGFNVLANSAVAAVETHCEKFTTPVSGGYCLTEDVDSPNRDLVYFFHGLQADEHSWETRTDIYDVWKKYKYAPPRVLSVSFGGVWVLAERNAKDKSGLYEIFVNQFMDMFEAKIGFDPRQSRRLLAGASMGGFNASQLLLKTPEKFSKVALICPAITTISPYSPPGDVWGYIFRTGANPFLVDLAMNLAKEYFESDEAWKQSAPLSLATTRLNSRTPKFHLSCGTKDEFGFFEGVQQMSQLARDRSAPIEYQPLPGKGHCSYDADALAAFIVLP